MRISEHDRHDFLKNILCFWSTSCSKKHFLLAFKYLINPLHVIIMNNSTLMKENAFLCCQNKPPLPSPQQQPNSSLSDHLGLVCGDDLHVHLDLFAELCKSFWSLLGFHVPLYYGLAELLLTTGGDSIRQYSLSLLPIAPC